MSMFSGETKVQVYSQAFPLMLAEQWPIEDTVLSAILSNNDISKALLNRSLNGISVQMNQLLTYAAESYTLGLPTGVFNLYSMVDDAIVEAAILSEVTTDHGITIHFNAIMPLTLQYIVLPFLLGSRGYDIYTQKITEMPAGLILDDLHPAYPHAAHTVTLAGLTVNADQTQITIEYLVNSYYLRSDKTGNNPEGGFTYESVVVPLPDTFYTETYTIPAGLVVGRVYCIAGYFLNDSEGVPGETVHWWYYDISSEKHEDFLEAVIADTANTLYPVVPIRYYNESMVREEVQETELYQTSKTLLSKISLDIHAIAESLEENPSIADIDHAYVMFGVDLQTEENVELQYLTEFFDYIADSAKIDIYGYSNNSLTGAGTAINTFAFNDLSLYSTPTTTTSSVKWLVSTNADGDDVYTTTTYTNPTTATSLIEHGLDTGIGFTYIHSSNYPGSIGPVGTATVEKTLVTRDRVGAHWMLDDSVIVFRHQIAEDRYKQVTVKGLVHTNHVQSGYRIWTTLSEVISNPDEHNFIIPLHQHIVQRLTALEQDSLHQNSIKLIVNAYEELDVAWYETSFFQFLVTLVGMVIMTYTAQPWLVGLNEAANVGFMAAIQYVLPAVLKTIILSVALNFVAQAIGPDAMAWLAVVAAAFAISQLVAPNLNMASWGKIFSAENLLKLSSGAFNAAQSETLRLIEDIAAQYDQFLIDSETKQEELAAAAELLETPDAWALNLLSIQTAHYVPDTKSAPSEFYDLRIHTGNIGTLALDAVSLYCELALKLPEFDGLAPEHMTLV